MKAKAYAAFYPVSSGKMYLVFREARSWNLMRWDQTRRLSFVGMILSENRCPLFGIMPYVP